MQGVQVDILGQQLQFHISLQLKICLSAHPVGLRLSSLGLHTNAGCSLLQVYQVRFQMADYAVYAVSATLPHTVSKIKSIARPITALLDCILYLTYYL